MDQPNAMQSAPCGHDGDGSPGPWAGMSPCEHFVHLYRDDDALLDLVESFVSEGLRGGEATVVIATTAHLATLERRLVAQGLDLVAARWQGQYLPMDARATLRQLMLPTGPDTASFARVMSEVLRRARRTGRGVRVFGEMVALLWADGHAEFTIELERMWNTVCADESLPMFCAYPEAAFGEGSSRALSEICNAHTRLVAA